MAGYLVNNAQPRGYALGFKDESRKETIPERVKTPQFYPLFYVLAQRTYDEAIVISGNGEQVLGKKTFEKGSPYYTHANAFVKKLLSKSNQFVVETIKLPGSSKAFLRISVEVVPSDIPVYERYSDETQGVIGSYVVNEYGGYTKLGTIRGSKLVHHTGTGLYQGIQKEFGRAQITQAHPAGTMRNGELLSSIEIEEAGKKVKASAATTLFPIVDIELMAYGADGNLTGMAIYSPTTRDDNGPFLADIRANRTITYRFMTVRKENKNSTPEIQYLRVGDQALDATFKPETISSLTKNPISLSKTLIPAYSLKATASQAAIVGDWGRIKVYEQSLETLLTMLANGYSVPAGNKMVDIEGEGSLDDDDIISMVREEWAKLRDPLNVHLINIFTGADHNGTPYTALTTSESVSLGGVSFDAGTPQFATGGADGIYYYADGRPAVEVNAKLFDDAVRSAIRDFGNGVNKYKDALRFPITTIVDSGFSLETKLQFPSILTKRPDMYIVSATHAVYDVGQRPDPNVRSIYRDGDVINVDNVRNLVADWGLCPQQSQVYEDAYGAALKAAFNTTMESEYFSTPVTRAIIRGQSGTVIEQGIWDNHLPLTYELMCQISDYAGDPSGIVRGKLDFTIEPNNVIKLMDNINNLYRENTSYSKLWDIGVVWSCSYDQFASYTPAVQTVYPYDDSILNSAKLMMACCRLEWINLVVHSRLTGRDDLTDEEFIKKTKEIAEKEVEGIFDGKYIVEAHPEILESDRDKGYIWRNFFHIYGNVMKTAMIYGVIARRMSDYTGG